jgi:hypothetical protein
MDRELPRLTPDRANQVAEAQACEVVLLLQFKRDAPEVLTRQTLTGPWFGGNTTWVERQSEDVRGHRRQVHLHILVSIGHAAQGYVIANGAGLEQAIDPVPIGLVGPGRQQSTELKVRIARQVLVE